MKSEKFIFKKVQGMIEPADEKFKEYIERWDELEERVVCIYEKPAHVRSLRRLKWYWGLALPAILFHLPEKYEVETPEELHTFLKEKYCFTVRQDLLEEVNALIAGEYHKVKIPFSVAFESLSPKEFKKYLDWVNAFALKECGAEVEELDYEGKR